MEKLVIELMSMSLLTDWGKKSHSKKRDKHILRQESRMAYWKELDVLYK